MARISGMILGLGLLVVLSSLSSPASADSDDDDNHYKYRRPIAPRWDGDDDDNYKRHGRYGGPVFAPPIVTQPLYAPSLYGNRYDRFDGGYGRPQYQPVPQAPLIPPLPPSQLGGGYYQGQDGSYSDHSTTIIPPAPPVTVTPHNGAGQFIDYQVPLYPLVRVKDGNEAPRFGLSKIVGVRSPDPLRFPGVVYVQVSVPPGPCKKVDIDDGGAKIKLEYKDYEIEIKSEKGVVTVEYDD